MKGKLNIEIKFPVIMNNDNEYSVLKDINQLVVSNQNYLDGFNKIKHKISIIDSFGLSYSIINIEKLNYVNFFFGFKLSSGFNNYNVNVFLEINKELSLEELKGYGSNIISSKKNFYQGTLIEIKRFQNEFAKLENREDILRYLFFFSEPSYFYNPDKKDLEWRNREGFIKE